MYHSLFAQHSSDPAATLMVWILIIGCGIAYYYHRAWRPACTAFGTAEFSSDRLLKTSGMLTGKGLVLGRTTGGRLIRIKHYTHLLLVGSTGSGKGVSVIIPNLLTYTRGSVVVFDTKGDLFTTCAERRQVLGQRVIRLAPFTGGDGSFNPLDTIAHDDPLLIDHARALAEALVVRSGSEPDQHWNDKSVQFICSLLVLVLKSFSGAERSLNAVQDIASDPEIVAVAADKLRDMGGIPARLSNTIKMLFEPQRLVTADGSAVVRWALTKEGSSVLSSVARHLAFLDSEPVARAMSGSSFSINELVAGSVTLFLQIPPDQLEAQKGLLRCWISTLIRCIGMSGREDTSETLLLLDEASALGSLGAVEEALVRGRSAGVRMLLAYQSDAQITSAFKDKPTILYDNCTVQIYLGASSYETAERISKSLGEYTHVLDSYGTNQSRSHQQNSSGDGQISRGSSMNYSQSGRALLRPEEVLTMSDDYLIAFIRAMPPVLARRVKWYAEKDFNPLAKRRWRKWRIPGPLWVILAGAILCVYAILAEMRRSGKW